MSKIELYNGDCLEIMDNLIKDGVQVDSIITDPPYGTTTCKWDTVIPFDKIWERLNKLIKSNGVVALFGSEPFSSYLRMSNIKNYKYDWKWLKSRPTGFQLANKRPMKDYEDIIIFYKKQPVYFNTELKKLVTPIKSWRKGGKGGNIMHKMKLINKNVQQEFTNFNRQTLKFNNEHNVGELKHPTQKPVLLMEYLIKTYTNENETVLDFTMGSGTTGLACKNTNRNFIGIELNKYYFEIAKTRINKPSISQKIF